MRLASLLGAALCAACSTSALAAESLVALTPTNQLLLFGSTTPGTTTSVTLTGLGAGETMLGIDQRPLDGVLYGISSASTVYSIDVATGQVTARGAAFAPPIESPLFGIDFNPTVDRIRFVDALSNNRRFVPATGATAVNDADLTYAAGGAPRAVGVAYTNSQLGGVAAGTVRELAIDSATDSLIEIGTMAGGNASFNAGVSTVIGQLMFDTTDAVGFDISGATGVYYASLTSPTGGSALYMLNPANGNASFVGAFSTGVKDIAVLVPEPTSLGLLFAGIASLTRRRR
ncbi:MAG: DUF4394 domain-containing protein [Lacipirellulaceae bacterium]